MGSKKVNFIHIPKTGGMAIRRNTILRPRVIPSTPAQHKSAEYTAELHRVMKENKEHHGNEHARWRDLNDKAKQRPSIAVVRNPWSRTVSRYTYLIRAVLKQSGPIVKINPTYREMSFEEFLEERHIYGGLPYFWHRAIKGWYQQKDYVTDEDGNLQCGVMRQERLNDDLIEYFRFDPRLQRRNISNNKKNYKAFYTPETKKIVEDWYGEDIEFFGFTFDGPATKNIWVNK